MNKCKCLLLTNPLPLIRRSKVAGVGTTGEKVTPARAVEQTNSPEGRNRRGEGFLKLKFRNGSSTLLSSPIETLGSWETCVYDCVCVCVRVRVCVCAGACVWARGKL